MDSEDGPVRRAVFYPLRKFGDSGRRFHLALLIVSALVTAGGLLAYGLVYPEIPFADTPVKLVGDVRADEIVKVYGRVECNCSKAIDREEQQAAINGRYWTANYSTFLVVDPSGKLFIDTDGVTRMTPGPSGGDWVDTDFITIYGSVYDQGLGNLALRAQMIAKTPTDTPAVYSLHFLVMAALGALAIAYVLTDRVVFGGPDE